MRWQKFILYLSIYLLYALCRRDPALSINLNSISDLDRLLQEPSTCSTTFPKDQLVPISSQSGWLRPIEEDTFTQSSHSNSSPLLLSPRNQGKILSRMGQYGLALLRIEDVEADKSFILKSENDHESLYIKCISVPETP